MRKFVLTITVMLTALMTVTSARAQSKEAYAVYYESRLLAFYYDDKSSSRSLDGTVYSIGYTAWTIHNSFVESVVFDPSFADYKPTTTSYWFDNCPNLTSIDGLQYLNTSEVTDMSYMFSGCSSLTSIDLSNFDTGNVTDMSGMFQGCSSLTAITVGDDWNTASVTSGDNMFWGCQSLQGGNGTTYDTSHIDKTYARVDGGEGKGYLSGKIAYVVYNSTSKILTFCYDDKNFDRQGDGVSVVSIASHAWTAWNSDVDLVVFESSFVNYKPTSTSNWFENCFLLSSIDGLQYLNTSEVTDMSYMFSGCSNLTSLDLSHFDTRNVTNMSGMFSGCSLLTTIRVDNGWNTSKVTSGDDMFWGCQSLQGGNGTGFDASHSDKTYARVDGRGGPGYLTAKEAYAAYNSFSKILTFYYDLESSARNGLPVGSLSWSGMDIDLVVFDSSFADYKPTTTSYWFDNCPNLTSIDGLQYLNTSEVTDMSYMFSGCSSLTSLDLSHFDTGNVTDMSGMFYGCSLLTTIRVDNGWNTSKVTSGDDMFWGCQSLQGGNGTTYDASYIDKTYARIDGGEGKGYLTATPESGVTTGVMNVINRQPATVVYAPMFNLQGQRVNGNYKGVVIQNRRKVMMR